MPRASRERGLLLNNPNYLHKNIPRKTSDVPRGLSTAHIGPQRTFKPYQSRNKPMMKRSNRGEAHVSYAVGGSISQVSFNDSGSRRRVSRTKGGGMREGSRAPPGRAVGTSSDAWLA